MDFHVTSCHLLTNDRIALQFGIHGLYIHTQEQHRLQFDNCFPLQNIFVRWCNRIEFWCMRQHKKKFKCHLPPRRCRTMLSTSNKHDARCKYRLLIKNYACSNGIAPHMNMYMHMCNATKHVEMYKAEKLFEDVCCTHEYIRHIGGVLAKNRAVARCLLRRAGRHACGMRTLCPFAQRHNANKQNKGEMADCESTHPCAHERSNSLCCGEVAEQCNACAKFKIVRCKAHEQSRAHVRGFLSR